MKRVVGTGSWLCVMGLAVLGIAAVVPPGMPPPPAPAPAPAPAPSVSSMPPGETCVESIPEGKERPKLTESFPTNGKAGHRAVLVVDVEHGPGERVLPSALDVDKQTSAFKALQAAGFRFPSSKGPSRPRLDRKQDGHSARTRFSLPLLLLPGKSGRQQMTLPPLPIAVARASGEVVTVCTAPHTITVEEPIANEPNPSPKPNPAPGRQLELFVGLRNGVYGGALGLVLATVLGLVIRAWRKRPKKQPPPPPPRPPWEVALEALADVRRSGWVEAGRFGEHFDRVSHVLRRYLGDRYGFDALESTTTEITDALRARRVDSEHAELIERCLDESDLVKFAKLTPTEAQCHWLWDSAHDVVQRTTLATPAAPSDIAQPNEQAQTKEPTHEP